MNLIIKKMDDVIVINILELNKNDECWSKFLRILKKKHLNWKF